MSNKSYYIDNEVFTHAAESQRPEIFRKYIDYVQRYLGSGSFLDVGCGTGIALGLLSPKVKGVGLDISKPSIKVCHDKGLDCRWYNGDTMPFNDASLDAVGSYNVLEHTEDPEQYLQEQVRVLKPGGYLIVACPNFLSVTNNFHWHTRGLLQKGKNLFATLRKILGKRGRFEKMATIDRDPPRPDDSACNVTNPIDIIKWGKNNKLKLQYWSSQSLYKPGLASFLDTSFLKLFFGSSFIIFKKS